MVKVYEIKERIEQSMKYIVRASKSGYAEIEADSEEEALEKAWYADYDWEDDVFDMEIVEN